MDSLALLFHGFELAFTWVNLLYCLVGVTVGMLVGVLPGLGPVTTTALLLPITYGMEPISAIIMLTGIFYAAMYGGTITSVLINVPGEAASIVTCIDGYRMARQGRAGAALGVAAIGSFIGGIVAVLALAFVGPTLARLALRFGPPEYFALLVFGLLMVVALMGRSVLKGLIAAVLGLLLSMIGLDPVSGAMRFTFGQAKLLDGLDFVVLVMGLYGVAEILGSIEKQVEMGRPARIQGLFPQREEWKPTLKAMGRGTALGMVLGLIPGANTVISSILSYALEKKVAKDPSRFGNGAIEGVAGPETANNAHAGAALIPLFTLGIPGSAATAVLLGGFIMHGLMPGPALFARNPDVVWGVIASMFIGNAILLVFNLPLAGVWAKLTLVPYKLLYPIILVFIMMGTYSVNGSVWDMVATLVFGIFGYCMNKLEIPLAATILTFVLGRQIETSLLQSLTLSENGALIFFQRPISATFLVLAIVAVVLSVAARIRRGRPPAYRLDTH